jgi:hypothetical protein
MIRPVYIHTPTSYVYEYPLVTAMPLGQYSMANSGLTWFNSNYYNNFGSGYRSLPVETPYSAAAMAVQGGKYPLTTMAVPNDLAYPMQYYTMSDYNNPLGMNYQMYGQLGMLPGAIA